MSGSKPKLLVFDLDCTLWPFWVDTHVTPPFNRSTNGSVVDKNGLKIDHYEDVPEVLSSLHQQGYQLAIASRTSELKGARQLLHLFGWAEYFAHEQIFPGCKITHFNNIKVNSGSEFSEMIFFDDDEKNIENVGGLGVLSILVRDGVTKEVIDDALQQFSNRF